MNGAGRPPARRVWLAPAYVLHQYAYRDTSRIVEVFTGEHGRLTLFARGANGPKSTLRGVLRPFQRMLVSWFGKGEACQLVSAEIDGLATRLAPHRLMSGFYLNELLLKLTERCDPHPEIFFSYAACVQALCDGEIEEPALRRFEKRLLDDLGYGLRAREDGRGRSRWTGTATTGSPRKAACSPAWPRRPARCMANPWPICRRRASAMPARCATPSAYCVRPSMSAWTAAPLKSRDVALALRHREPPDALARRNESLPEEYS